MAVRLKLKKRKRMEESMYSDTGFFDDDDFEVAEILLQLPQLIAKERDASPFPLSWCAKGRRSAIDPSPSTSHHPSPATPPPFPTLVPHSCNGSKSNPKFESSSPTAPFSFPLSESDSKPVVLKKKKTKKQDYLEMIEHLTEDSRILKEEIPKMTAQNEMLKRTNLMLKQRLQEMSSCGKQNENNLNSNPRVMTGNALEESSSRPPAEREEEEEVSVRVLEKAEDVMERLTPAPGTSKNCSSKEPYEQELGMAKQLSPLGLPNLNLSAEESLGSYFCQQSDLSRAAIAAQARKRRIEINRHKKVSRRLQNHVTDEKLFPFPKKF